MIFILIPGQVIILFTKGSGFYTCRAVDCCTAVLPGWLIINIIPVLAAGRDHYTVQQHFSLFDQIL